MVGRMRLGEILRKRALVEESVLEEAAARQLKTGDRLGEVLTSEGHLRPYDLYEALSEQQGVPLADLRREPPDAALLVKGELEDYLRHRCLPWKREGKRFFFACAEVDDAAEHYMRNLAGKHYVPEAVLATPRDILHAVEQSYGVVLDARAREHLLRAAPHYSFHAQRGQGAGGLLALAGVCFYVAGCFLWPELFIAAGLLLCNLFYLATMLLKPVLFFAGSQVEHLPTAAMLAALPEEKDLPVYTLLVPLYREAEGIPRLISALTALDYPKSRLDVKLIVEADDTQTINAILAAKPPAMFELLRVPYSLPRTKPKACNYALTFARGEFVTIYDAEDKPDADQLKKAVAIFRSVPEEVVCLQARLNYYNREENLLTRMFAIEYGGLFNFMLPGLQALGIPIPLGGTSNHLRLQRLRELGEWDPYNVTEDADLGIRLATEGLETLPFDSLTLEEAPVLILPWIRQRTRWIKGYVQTWQVAMRRMPVLFKRFGAVGFVGFQLFVGAASLVYMFSPLLWILSAFWGAGLLTGADFIPLWLKWMSLGTFGLGFLLQWALAAVVALQAGWKNGGMVLAVLFYPFYWLLHSLASLRALWQLIYAPYYWDKTPHGLSRLIPA